VLVSSVLPNNRYRTNGIANHSPGEVAHQFLALTHDGMREVRRFTMLTIRAANDSDRDEVARVHVRTWQVAYRGLLPDEYLDQLRPEDRAARYTFASDDPHQRSTLVALDDEAVCGFTTFGVSRDGDLPDAGEIYAIYVDPDQWGTGAGRLLMANARSRLNEMGFRDAFLWVLDGNDRAQRFYEIDQWSPDGIRRHDEAWGITVNEVRYRRSLRSSRPTRETPV
jgi:ribosomal protein S18 acetylase RimI-like enzyme